MKILFVRTMPYYLNPTSYNVQAIGLGRAFVKMGHDFDYVCPRKKKERIWTFCEENGHVGRCLEKKRIRFIRWGIYTQLLDKKYLAQYDLIISQEYYQIMTWLMARLSTRVVMYNGPYYNLFMFKFFSPIYDFFMTKRIDQAIKVKFVKSVLSKDFLERKGYHNVINIGVGLDLERFEEKVEPDEQTRAIVDYMTDNACLLYIGSIMDRKNYPFMIKLYDYLLDEYPNLKFVVIGKSKIGPFRKMLGGKDDDYEASLQKNIPNRVKSGLLRVQKLDNSQLKFIYPKAKAFLLPSKKEIFGMVLPEAMYLGAPVITSKNGGSMTLIGEDGPGQMIEDFDVKKWSLAVRRYLKDPEYVQRVKQEAHELVQEKYTWEAIAQKLINNVNP